MKIGKRLCCYAVDENYLLPAMLSALQLKRFSPGVDVAVFCIGQRSRKIDVFCSVFRKTQVDLVVLSPDITDGMPMAFARFFLHRMVSDQYESVVYIDGDTQVCDDIRPLLDYNLCSGGFLAARDPMAILVPDGVCRRSRSYLASIGLDDEAAALYCNSGVLRFNLSEWEEISSAVIAASRVSAHRYRFPDQDPLNLLFGRQYQLMSYMWNFPSFFLGLGLADLIKPKILHFMSDPRPWDGPFRPWNDRYFRLYDELVEEFPEISSFWMPFSLSKRLRYHCQQYIKQTMERSKWSNTEVLKQIAAIEARSVV